MGPDEEKPHGDGKVTNVALALCSGVERALKGSSLGPAHLSQESSFPSRPHETERSEILTP
jgi:hypothetical protein